MDTWFEAINVDTFPPVTAEAVATLAIGVGVLYCFLGYRVLKAVVFLTGFGLAGAVGGALCAWVSHGNVPATCAGVVIGGLAGGVALLMLYRVGVFCLGLLAGALIAQTALSASSEPWVLWAVIGAGAAGGLVALVIERPVMTLATAALGGWLVVAGAAFIVLGNESLDSYGSPLKPEGPGPVMVACWAVLSLAGAIAQFSTRRKPGKKVVVVQDGRN